MAGFSQIPNEVLEQLAKRNFNGTQMSIILAVLRFTYGFQRGHHDISLNFLEKHTGIKKKRLSKQVNELINYRVFLVYGDYAANQESRKIGLNNNFHEWTVARWTVPQNGDSPPKEEPFPKRGTEQSPNSGTETVPQNGDQERNGLKKDLKKDSTATSGADYSSSSGSGYQDIMAVHTKVFNTLQMTGLMSDYVQKLLISGHSEEFVKELMLETGESSPKPSIRYMKTIGDRWIAEGITSREESAAKRNAGSAENVQPRFTRGAPDQGQNKHEIKNNSIKQRIQEAKEREQTRSAAE